MISRNRVLAALQAATLTCAAACVEVPSEGADGASFRATNADVHTQLASAALERGSLEPARASAREALRVDPGRVEAARILARADLLSGESRAALQAAKRAAALAPEDAATWLLLADCAAAADDGPQRDAALLRAAELGSQEARFVRAFEALAHGDSGACSAILADEVATRDALGLVVDHLGVSRIAEALAVVEAQIARSPNPALALTADRLRLALAAHGTPGDSESDAPPAPSSASATLEPATTEQILLAAAYDLQGNRPTTAADRYRALLASEPENVELRIALAEALLAAGDPTGALAAYRAALSVDHRDLTALHGVARLEIEQANYDAALDLLEGARGRQPNDPATLALVVVAAQRSGRIERAHIAAERLAELDPGGRFDLACRRLLAHVDAPTTAPAQGGP